MGEKKVLLVEDERPITKAIATMLGANGLVVDVASTAEMALTQIASNGYDLVVIDASLPDQSGFALCQTLRLREDFDALPIILMTIRSTDIEVRKAKAVGATATLTKPFGPAELRTTLAPFVQLESL
ncbi:hypothetical protein B9057_15320 (plasmid) [Aestuarium zhoushanense]|nr:hypothetical protein B9057_15320 [Aestuarium zhoushanense]